MTRYQFPEGFFWGAAASGPQTEGISNKPHRSIWDSWFAEQPERFYQQIGPQTVCDTYHQYPQDVALMKRTGFNSFRTSIQWSRLIDDFETGAPNPDAVRFYHAYLDEMIENGIEPMICLEHYELPGYLLEQYGGWASKKVVELFVQYAEKVFARYHHKVTRWFTFNEPIVVQTRVYLDALRWPYEQNTGTWMQWNHHKVLATAKVVRLFREKGYRGTVGCILNPEVTYPRSKAPHDVRAAERYDLFYNRVFLDPLVHGLYPPELLAVLEQHGVSWDYNAEELAIIRDNTVDELGINLYYPHRVKAPSRAWHPQTPFHPAYYYEPFELPGRRMNHSRGWEIYPQIVFDMAMRIKQDYRNIPWFVAESGMGVENEGQFRNGEGTIADDYRIRFISEHLWQTLRAREAGANCHGYMLWAFTDNVSPMNAFKNRYGLIEIDLQNNLARRPKASASWFRKLGESRELTLDIDDEWR